jgi:hypothetical protein
MLTTARRTAALTTLVRHDGGDMDVQGAAGRAGALTPPGTAKGRTPGVRPFVWCPRQDSNLRPED